MKNSGSFGIELREFGDIFSWGEIFPKQNAAGIFSGESHHFKKISWGEAGMLDLDEVPA